MILVPEGVYDFRDTPRATSACPSTCTENAALTEYAVLTASQTCPVALVPQTRDEQTLSLGSNKTIVGMGAARRSRG